MSFFVQELVMLNSPSLSESEVPRDIPSFTAEELVQLQVQMRKVLIFRLWTVGYHHCTCDWASENLPFAYGA